MTSSIKSDTNVFEQEIKNAYVCKGESLVMGSAILNNAPIPDFQITIPLKTINRQGLIAGATGTGKTKTIQKFVKALSASGVSVLFSKMLELNDNQAIITVLSEEGKPTPLVHTMMALPESRMDTITQAELSNIVQKSSLYAKYNETVDRESAYEILTVKMAKIVQEEKVQENEKPKSQGMSMGELVTRQAGRTFASELTRSLARGLLGGFLGGAVASAVTGTTRRRAKSKKRYY